MSNKPYLVALNCIPTVGPRTIEKILLQWPQLKDFFSLSAVEMQSCGLQEKTVKHVQQFNWTTVENELRWEEERGNHIITIEDPGFPPLLKEIAQVPPVLYARGDVEALSYPKIAMVGTRKPSVAGGEIAYRFAAQLAQHGVAIVSGLALGIDGQSHRGCLQAKGRTIAVLGTGIDAIYPARHHDLAEQIIQEGLLLSEFPLKTKPIAGHFPRRNRIICGLSLATLVVEAALRSGSLITAYLALEQNRDVFAIPSSIHNPQARGCHHLLQQGAKLVTCVEEVVAEVLPQRLGVHKNKQNDSVSDTIGLLQFIGFEITTVDQIQVRSGKSLENITCDLAMLEIKGVIRAVTGGYVRCAS